MLHSSLNEMTDFILNSEGQVAVGESTRQHQRDLLVIDKGWQKFHPTRGVGLLRQVGDEGATGEWQGGRSK